MSSENSMKVITLGESKILVGLAWEVLDIHDKGERKALKETLSKYKGVKYAARVNHGLFRSIGVVPAGTKPPKEPSGAALLALANQSYEMDRGGKSSGTSASGPSSQSSEESNWILIESAGRDDYWLAIIKDGQPLPGSDILIKRDEVLSLVVDLLTDSPQFVVHSPDDDIRSHLSMKSQVTNKGFQQLVGAQGIKASKGQVKQIAGIPSIAITGTIVFVLLVGAWAGYEYIIKKQRAAQQELDKIAKQAAKDALELKERSDYSDKVRGAVLDALAEGKKDVDEKLVTASPGQLVEQWMITAITLPHNYNGWAPAGFACSADKTKTSCLVNLNRGPIGIDRLLAEARPDAVVAGDKASFRLPGELGPLRPADWSRLESASSLSLGLVSDMQLLKGTGVSYKVGTSKEIEKPVTLPPPPKSIFKAGRANPVPTVAPVKMGVGTGKLTISGADIWQLEGVTRLANHPALSVTKINMTPSGTGSWSWSVDFDYLIRTSPTPILPVVVLPDNTMVNVELPAEFNVKMGSSVGGVVAPSEQTGTVAEPVAPPAPPVSQDGLMGSQPALAPPAPVQDIPPPPPPASENSSSPPPGQDLPPPPPTP